MADFTLTFDENEKKVLLDILRNHGANSDSASVCRSIFMRLQTAEPDDKLVLPEIEEGAICESCQ